MWPFRLLLSGPPGCGKRSLLMNVLDRMDPKPSAYHICHFDPETKEYDELQLHGKPMYYYDPDDFPTTENLTDPEDPPIGSSADAEERKTLGPDPSLSSRPFVIIDELTSDVLSPESRSRFERLMNYGSTHKNTSVACCIQSVVNLPPRCRRGFSHYVLWEQPDKSASTLAATRSGITPAVLETLFGLCETRFDSIWIDTDQTPDSEWRFRLNVFSPISLEGAIQF